MYIAPGIRSTCHEANRYLSGPLVETAVQSYFYSDPVINFSI